MWSEIRPILFGILLFALLNCAATIALPHTALNTKFHRSMENYLPQKLTMLESAQPQILVLGTSQTNNDFDTADFDAQLPNGLSSFNLGLPGTRYDVMLANLKNYKRQYGSPRLLILEVSPTIMERNTNQYYLPALQLHSLIENNPNMLADILTQPSLAANTRKELLFGLASSLYEFRPIFSPINIHNRLISKAHEKLFPAAQTAPEATTVCYADKAIITPSGLSRGWNPKSMSPMMCSSKGIAQNAEEAKAFYLDPLEQIDFTPFHHILDYCAQNKIPVVLVVWPNHPAFSQQFAQSRFYKPYHQQLQQTLASYPVPFINLDARKPGNLEGLFADTRHLTPKGARYFSKELASTLLQSPEIRPILTQPEEMLAEEAISSPGEKTASDN